jgi:hypothetical protein
MVQRHPKLHLQSLLVSVFWGTHDIDFPKNWSWRKICESVKSLGVNWKIILQSIIIHDYLFCIRIHYIAQSNVIYFSEGKSDAGSTQTSSPLHSASLTTSSSRPASPIRTHLSATRRCGPRPGCIRRAGTARHTRRAGPARQTAAGGGRAGTTRPSTALAAPAAGRRTGSPIQASVAGSRAGPHRVWTGDGPVRRRRSLLLVKNLRPQLGEVLRMP